MEPTIAQFFTGAYEEEMNKSILYYSFSEDEARRYVEKLLVIPLISFVEYMDTIAERQQIEAGDVFQFSNLDNATSLFCEKMRNTSNPGMKFVEMGKILLDDGVKRKDGALTKYGENHAKTATMLGLAFELCNTYYLSGIGYIYATLSKEQQTKLLSRLILRNKLVVRLYQASKNGQVDMKEFLYMLSDSTYDRRRSNIKKILKTLNDSDEYDFKYFLDKIYFK